MEKYIPTNLMVIDFSIYPGITISLVSVLEMDSMQIPMTSSCNSIPTLPIGPMLIPWEVQPYFQMLGGLLVSVYDNLFMW